MSQSKQLIYYYQNREKQLETRAKYYEENKEKLGRDLQFILKSIMQRIG